MIRACKKINSPLAYVVMLLLCAPVLLWAQGNPLSGRDTLVLVGERIESLPEAAKPGFSLPKPDITFDRRGLNFSPDSIPYHPQPRPFEIYRAPVPRPYWQPIYNNHIMGGIGAWVSPLFRAYFSNGRDLKKHLLVQAEHFSTPNGHVEFGTFARTRVSVAGKYSLKKVTLRSHLNFLHNQYFSYNDTLIDVWRDNPASMEQLELERAIRQRYMRIEWQGGMVNHVNTDALSWEWNTRLRLLNDRRDNQEVHASLLGNLAWQLKPHVLLTSDLEATTMGLARPDNPFLPEQATDTRHSNQNFVQVTQTVRWTQGPIRLEGGLRLGYVGMDDSASVHIYPMLSAAWKGVPKMTVYADVTGRMHNFSRWQALEDNPWLSAEQAVLPWNERLMAQVGTRYNHKQFHADAGFFVRQSVNMPVFFAPEATGQWFGQQARRGHFLMLQEELLTAVGFQGQLRADWSPRAFTAVIFRAQNFAMDNLPHYFHVPSLSATVNASYVLAKKVKVRADFHLIGARPMGLDEAGNLLEQPAFADLNLHLEYMFSRRFSLFCQFNNLLNQEYYRWNGYIERPLDFRMGGTVSF